MNEIEEVKIVKKNNLNTKSLPPIFMLVAGFISLVISLTLRYDMRTLLFIVFISMLIFAILGTVVKTVVDNFNMKNSYEDLLEEEDTGNIREK